MEDQNTNTSVVSKFNSARQTLNTAKKVVTAVKTVKNIAILTNPVVIGGILVFCAVITLGVIVFVAVKKTNNGLQIAQLAIECRGIDTTGITSECLKSAINTSMNNINSPEGGGYQNPRSEAE